jgi:tRNA(Ile)-lysidine synthase
VALLRALREVAPGAGLRLSVAHLDHGERGEEGRADAAFVAGLAEKLGLPYDLGSWRPWRSTHFEADARRARYDWLVSVARARGASAVAVGHSRDDQAETVLHRAIRGTGVAGLAGMPVRRALAPGVALVRPLLDVSREDLRAYLSALGQDFREDPTNADVSRTRARIRHDLLPRLAAGYNPRVAEALARLGRLAAEASRALRAEASGRAAEALVEANPGAVVLRVGPLARCPAGLRAEVLRHAWRAAGWPEGGMTEARWRRLSALAVRADGRRRDVGAGVAAVSGQDMFTLSRSFPTARPEQPPPAPLAVPGSAPWAGGRVVAALDPSDPRDETVDLERVSPPLVVRAPRPGDRFEPLGMGGQSQPLNDFFRARRVTPAERVLTPLVVDAAGVVWVVGHRVADRVRVTPATSRFLGLRWVPEAGCA